jgi:phage baseplate assembly protein gpV
MSSGLFESLANASKEDKGGEFSIAPGVVKDNLNVLSEGTVQVHIPTLPDFDPWARVIGIGGGSGRGFLWIPEVDDEVLVAFAKNDDRDAYVIGGLWSTSNRPPVTGIADLITKRVIKTGKKNSPLGHTIEIDDALQSITITTSTKQEIVLDKGKIAISTSQGLLKITMDILSAPPAIQIEATTGDIKLSAPLGTISLEGMKVEVNGTVSTEVKSSGQLTVQGTIVQIN